MLIELDDAVLCRETLLALLSLALEEAFDRVATVQAELSVSEASFSKAFAANSRDVDDLLFTDELLELRNPE